MTLKERIRAGVIITIALVAIGFVFLGNQRPVHASGIGGISGGAIDQGVFCFLDQFPTTDVFNTGCAPTASAGTLTVIKTVSGTTTPALDFSIYVASSTPVANSPQPGNSSGTAFGDLTPGTYTVSEQVNAAGVAAGVTMSEFTQSFSTSCTGGTISVAANQNATCTITNTYIPPVVTPTTGGLVVKKVIVNTGGGTATANEFSFKINGGAAVAFNANGENDISGLATGAYAVTEVATTTYTSSLGTGCSGSIVANSTSTCTITNTFSSGGGGNTQSNLTITKTANDPKTESATTANIGDAITYTITVSNAGPATAIGVTVNDTLPSGVTYVSDDSTTTSTSYNPTTGVWTVGGILNGSSDVLHIVATVNSGTGGTTITNSASVSDTNGDSNSNNTANAAVTVNTPNSSTSSDVGVSKSADNTAPNIGATVTYTITASDSGANATGVVVQDTLPSTLTYVSDDGGGSYNSGTGVWTIGTLSSTTPATLHIVTTVNSGVANGTVITNVAAVTAGDTSNDTENNSSPAPITVTIPTSNNGGGGGGGAGGGGNGPIVGSYGGGGGNGPIVPNGQVLGASTSTPNSCTQYLTAFIRTGQQNDSSQVKRLQTFLNTYEGGHLTVNGIYDAATLAATEAFQKTYGADILTPWGIKAPTGYVYLTTRKEVNTIYCHFTQNFPLTPAQQAIINASLTGSHGSVSTAVVSSHSSSPAGPKNTGTSLTSSTGQTAAASVILNTSGTSSGVSGSSTPVTNNPFNNIGNFFKHLFGH